MDASPGVSLKGFSWLVSIKHQRPLIGLTLDEAKIFHQRIMELQNTEGEVLNTAPGDEQDSIMQLVQIIQSPDTTPADLNDAFSMLYAQLKSVMYQAAYRVTSNRDDIEGIVNHAFSKFSSYLRTKKYTDRPEPFLVYLIRNEAIDMFRRENRAPIEVPIEYAENIGEDDKEQKAISSHDALVKLIERLPSVDQQKVIIYHYFYDMSLSEIAERLGRGVGEIYVLHHRALQRLRQFVSDEVKED